MRARRAARVLPPACALAVLAGVAGCDDTRSSASFEQSAADGGDGLRLQARWQYRSPEVDVDIELVTVLGADSTRDCVTTARLRVDEALAGGELYRLPETACSELRLDAQGDLVLLDSPTGLDWSGEAIDVDTERELIRLGPLHDPDSDVTYRFALGAPPCSDDPSCECPRLERRAGDVVSALELGRDCD